MKRTPLLYWLLALALMTPAAARATGSLTIPNTIAAQSGPNVQASLLDTNWTTIATYVNAREVASGTLAARPIAGTAGRWYFASDDNGGTLYFDTGAAWVQASPAIQAGQDLYGSRNLNGATASATNTSYNVSADYVRLRNPTTGATVVRPATSTLTNNVLTSGPAADGRDQSAAFTVSTWVHFYYVWNGSTLATVSSTCAPNTFTGSCPTVGGPNLPATYTHWSYIGPVQFATTGVLNATFIRGSRASINPIAVRANAATGIGAEATITVTNFIPPNHMGATLHLCSNRVDLSADLRVESGGTPGLAMGTAGGAAVGCVAGDVPLKGQTVYLFTPAAVTASIMLSGYRIPNGAE